MTEQMEMTEQPAEEERTALPLVQAALYSDYAPSTLMKMRSEGTGPPSFKRGGRVLFYQDDIDAWLESRRDIRPTTWRKT